MRKTTFIMAVVFLLWAGTPHAWAAEGQNDGHGMDSGKHDMGDMKDMDDMNHFKHQTVVDGIRSEFEVMSLASMKMKDREGNTHHIMVKFLKKGMDHPMAGVVGKIKVIGPDKKEQTNALKDYNGILAANFTFKDKGKYGVICLFKVGNEKHTVKFWYPHKE